MTRLRRNRRIGLAAAGVAAVGALCLAGPRLARAGQTPHKELDPASLAMLPEGAGDGDFAIGPDYKNAADDSPRADVPHGMIYHFTMDSTESKMYSGIAKNAPGEVVPYRRNVTVYVPAQYKPGTPAPVIISQDSMGAGGNLLPNILDNLTADKKLPPIVAIMINSGGGDAQGSQRGLEYDTVSGKYAEFIESEVIPRVETDYKVKITKNPEGRMTMGGSSGASCAFTMAWFHPEWYHRCLLYSSTLVDQESPLNPASPHGAWEYHEHFIPQEKAKPIRIWDEVGENDIRNHDPESTYHNWVLANLRFAQALKAKKYHYQFVFARNAGHVDGRAVGQTLPAALEYVWKGYKTVKN